MIETLAIAKVGT